MHALINRIHLWCVIHVFLKLEYSKSKNENKKSKQPIFILRCFNNKSTISLNLDKVVLGILRCLSPSSSLIISGPLLQNVQLNSISKIDTYESIIFV